MLAAWIDDPSMRVKLGGRNYSEAFDVCASPRLQVIVTEDLSVLASFKLLIASGYAPFPRNSNSSPLSLVTV